MIKLPFEFHKKQLPLLPKITVVTPSYNQGQFIEETILSVLNQDYPNLEYIIMDGGSTDETVEIIKKYEDRLTFWESKKDNGQADAINKGFSMSTGDIICWLNSDDCFIQGALWYAASEINTDKCEIIFGNCFHYNENSSQVTGSNVQWSFKNSDISYHDYVIQPSSFFTKKAWEAVGELNTSLHYVFDWEWFIRAKKKGIDFRPVDYYLSEYRLHSDHKTGTGKEKRNKEFIELVQKHADKQNVQLLNSLVKKKKNLDRVRYRIPLINEKRLYRMFFPKLNEKELSTLKFIEQTLYY